MAYSANGYSVGPANISRFTIPGTSVKVALRRGDVSVVLLEVARRFNNEVEKLRQSDTGGYSYRRIRGRSGYSNHASGTAIDLRWRDHPLGSRNTFSPGERAAIRRILRDMGGVVRWGGDYRGRVDCFSGDTMLITSSGPRPIRDLVGQDVELLSTTADPTTGEYASQWVKAPVASYGWDNTYDVTLRRRGTSVVVRTTAGHRWPVARGSRRARFVTTESLMNLRAGEGIPALEYPQVDQVELVAEEVARGIVWGDGSVYNRHGGRTPQACVTLCGQKAGELRRFIEPYARYWQDTKDGPRAFGLPASLKALPASTSPAVAAGFFAGWFATDGNVSMDVGPSLSTSSTDALRWLQEAAPMLGLTISGVGVQKAGESGFGSTKDNYQVRFRSIDERLLLRPSHRQAHPDRRALHNWLVVSVEPTGCAEEVFCPTVAGRNVVALATSSMPLLSGQSMHFEINASPAHVHVLADRLRSRTGKAPAPPLIHGRQRYNLAPWPWNSKAVFHPYLKGTPPVYSTVEHVQHKLWSIGYQVASDGRFGPATRAAVMDFQRRHGLQADGLIGIATYSKLRAS